MTTSDVTYPNIEKYFREIYWYDRNPEIVSDETMNCLCRDVSRYAVKCSATWKTRGDVTKFLMYPVMFPIYPAEFGDKKISGAFAVECILNEYEHHISYPEFPEQREIIAGTRQYLIDSFEKDGIKLELSGMW